MIDRIKIYIDPQKYKYTECDHCHGYGSNLRESAPKCTKCGGTGLVKIKKEK